MFYLLSSVIIASYIIANCKSKIRPGKDSKGSKPEPQQQQQGIGNPNNREMNDSIRTQVKNGPGSGEDVFKDLKAKLDENKAKETTESLLAEDEVNPLANFQIPERPVVKNGAGGNPPNCVEMQQKPKAKNSVERNLKGNMSRMMTKDRSIRTNATIDDDLRKGVPIEANEVPVTERTQSERERKNKDAALTAVTVDDKAK